MTPLPGRAILGMPLRSGRLLSIEGRCVRALIIACAIAAGFASVDAAGVVRERMLFDEGWRFVRGDPPGAADQLAYEKLAPWLTATGDELLPTTIGRPSLPAGDPGADVDYVRPDFDDSSWRLLDLPHDWGIEGEFRQEYPGETGKLEWWGIGWYRKHFSVSNADALQRMFLDLDGAMSHAAVWLNGQFVGGWAYGYASFRLDLTPFLRFGGDNVLAIRLDNPPDSSRWYPGGGIYRHVWLVTTPPVHVAHWGTYVTTPVITNEAATVAVQVTVENRTSAPAMVGVAVEIFQLDADGRKIGPAVATAAPQAATKPIPPGRQALVASHLTIASPKLWGLRDPHRYVAVVSVTHDEVISDREETVFGIRTAVFDAKKGFLLNGERVPLQGVCLHHDLGALGTALNSRALERQLRLLQEMGCNAIRTSHNPPAPELLDLCDRLGFVVMDEAFDCWRTEKKPNDYHRDFPAWHEKDLRALVRRDRNHPSVVLWSLGNEIYEQNEPEGWKLAGHLAEIVRGEDRTRPISAGLNVIASGYNGFQTVVDVMGYNYKPFEYVRFHASSPAQPLFGAETSSCVSSRGAYFFPVSTDKLEGRFDFQISSYDLYSPRWGMPPDTEFGWQDASPNVAGEFVWTGFDYLGEPTPYSTDATNLLNFTDPQQQARVAAELASLKKIAVPSRSSYFGIIDLAGFKKDRFFLYQARWRPDLPMAHILPHWTWPDRVGEITPVHVYTSGDEAELFLNGRSLGRKQRGAREYRLRWDEVRYEPGELRVVAYRQGAKWAEDVVTTSGAPAKLVLTADRSELRADGEDLAFVSVAVVDSEGRLVPQAANRIRFEVSGPAEIVATDNGDATDFTSFRRSERAAFNGLALAIVRPKRRQAGVLVLTARAEGLPATEITLNARLP